MAGAATLELGGPQGETFEVAAGDVLVLPAGTPAEVARARERILALGAPPDDPVGGDGVAGWR